MYSFEDLRHLHLEPTLVCSAACPMCARNAFGRTLPNLPSAQLSIETFTSMAPKSFFSRLTGFDLCGAYGDPALARDLLAIVSHVRESSSGCTITVYTHGGIRERGWWAELAAVLGEPSLVVFAIDGIGETHSIHRRGVSFDKVIENAKAFIDAGGAARWELVAFRHNEHQISQARELSREIGFRQFSVKRTDRFLQPLYEFVDEYQDGYEDLLRFPIHDRDGEPVGFLEPPDDSALVNDAVRRYEELIRPYGSLDALLEETPIRCRVADSASVFVGAQGYAFPCCWTYVHATRPDYGAYPEGACRRVSDLVAAHGGFAAIDVRRVGLEGAVEGPLFGAIAASWSCPSLASGRLRVCARACGTRFPAYFNQFSEGELQPRGLRSPS